MAFDSYKGTGSDQRNVKLTLRQLTRNGKFQDLFFYIFRVHDQKKQKLIIERMKRDYRFKYGVENQENEPLAEEVQEVEVEEKKEESFNELDFR